jgi:hypothetical protein
MDGTYMFLNSGNESGARGARSMHDMRHPPMGGGCDDETIKSKRQSNGTPCG